MNVLSLFGGIEPGLVALKKLGIKIDNYYSSEVDKYAIQIAKKNHPEIIHLGDITKWREWVLPEIDLIIGGRNSPVGSKQEWDWPFQRLTKKGTLKKGVGKASCLTVAGHSGGNHSDMDIIHTPLSTRRYSVIECERLQTLPDNYTDGISNTRRYKALGNCWTVVVIEHIFKYLPKE